MITEKYINDLIKQYIQSPAGRDEIKKKYGIDVGAGDKKGRSNSIKKSECRRYGEQMKNILFAYVNPIIKSITLDDIIVGEPTKVDGQWTLNISFREGSLKRESLYFDNPDPEGETELKNIVLLFAKGYHAKNYVYGLWDTSRPGHFDYRFHSVRSRKDRDGNDFLIKAINQFNTTIGSGVAVAELLGDYKTCSENPQ